MSTSTSTGRGWARASAAIPPVRPRSASTGGWMPRTSERSSASAVVDETRASAISAAAAAGSWSTSSCARPRFMPRATSCACAPSCRSRSIRRSSAAEWSTVRAREDSSSPIRCCSRASCGPISSRVVAASVRSSRGDPHQPSGRNGKAISAASWSANPMVCTSSSQARSRQVFRSLSRNRRASKRPSRSDDAGGSATTVPRTRPASLRCTRAKARSRARQPSSSGIPTQMTSSAMEAINRPNSTKPTIRRPSNARQCRTGPTGPLVVAGQLPVSVMASFSSRPADYGVGITPGSVGVGRLSGSRPRLICGPDRSAG